MDGLANLSVLTSGKVAVSEDQDNRGLLKLYNLNNGHLIWNLTSEGMKGMTEVFVDGKHCLAISLRWVMIFQAILDIFKQELLLKYIILFDKKYCFNSEEQRIEFRNVDSLDKVILKHSVTPHKPNYLCTIPPSTLLFEDVSSKPRTIKKLDCSLSPSNPTPFIRTELNEIWDINFIEQDKKQFIFITDGYNGLFVYNGHTRELEWRIEGNFFTGITADKWGHLFQVDDLNKAVKMYTVEGTYLGDVDIEKDEFPHPWRISWCREKFIFDFGSHQRLAEAH